VHLDRIDFAILEALQKDGRLANKELAALVGLAPSSCFERVRRLRRAGVLLGTHARVSPGALGVGLQAMVAVRLRSQSRAIIERIGSELQARRELVAAYHMAGGDDFLFHVAVRDADHLRRLVVDNISNRKEVRHVETSLIFEVARNPALPCYVGSDPG
jgi:DNA-binding Lrp family transcriptional regulator